MKILLLYYTGTYNTRYITNLVKDELIKNNNEVDCVEVNIDTKPISLDKYDQIGIGYPIYAFNCPKLLINYLRKLKLNNHATYFIYKNSGESFGVNNASSRKIKHLLHKQKIIINNEYHFLMPYNIMFRFTDSCVKEMIKYNKKLVKIMLYEIDHHIEHKIKSNLFYEINSFVFSIQNFGAKFNSYFYKVNENNCIHCNKCVNNCPTHNIVIKDGKIKFNHNCLMCMRCSMSCPTDAIKIGLLNNWKVNKPYNIDAIIKNEEIDDKFIETTDKKFFNCYRKDYQYINKKYNSYFNK